MIPLSQKTIVQFSILAVAVAIVIVFGWFNWASRASAGNFYDDNTGTDGVVPVFAASSEEGGITYGYGIEIQTQFAGGMVT